MSNYFEALKRLQQITGERKLGIQSRRPLSTWDMDPTPALPVVDAAVAAPPPPEPVPVRREPPPSHGTLRLAPRPVERTSGYSTLLDAMRSREPSPLTFSCVIVAPASDAESMDDLLLGLVEEGRKRGVRVLLGHLRSSTDGRLIEVHRLNRSSRGDSGPLELQGLTERAQLDEWLLRQDPNLDLVAIEAPPLCESAEGALLARLVTGLYIVVEMGRTRTDALQKAARRAREMGERIHGLVVTEARPYFPDWVARTLGSAD